MEQIANPFKRAIMAGQQQIGLWSTIRDNAATEMLANVGYDWMLLDCEHTPNDVVSILNMLQAMSTYGTAPMVRPTELNGAEIKRLLDIGAQNLLIPYVQTAEEAAYAAEAVDYAPRGFRGMGGSTRANRFGTVPGYFTNARDEICLLVQIETQKGLDNLEAIVNTPGVDGVFIGPADLSASLGHAGNARHEDVKAAIVDAIKRIRACGKPAGFLSTDPELNAMAVQAGSVFTAVDVDMVALQRVAREQLKRANEAFK
ncbi:4-hydroxy-2-oxo-heptane-1,7-dioate aldolase [Donghicola sp. C2-DW-16]|uniref:4-hydroxy-2-oxo-heptane-1,7-dioate aldolase n=1 Tax=Donghicola mangrovi TaxID=2729614 RepID=A0ABX2PHL5_9RHOB|nr:aldolase/citrate lyase family protein [Donghicola mangrovi]NVO28606.1 4-hydroxy-2-oxo-heptane-1,7-dioate aldolase [Donghicola mangrovi]